MNLLSAHNLVALLTSSAPAFFYGCISDSQIEISAGQQGMYTSSFDFNRDITTSEGKTLDIFVFEDDRLRRLDTYLRIDDFDKKHPAISSTGGNKIFFFCSDGHRSKYDWGMMTSYSSLGKIYADLENETLANPTMTGECLALAGTKGTDVTLRPLTSEIALRTISCDFRGTEYADRSLTNVKVYLTNVNATCPLLTTETTRPIRMINTGQLNMTELKDFQDKGIVFRKIAERVDQSCIGLDIRLLCYQNTGTANNPGAPETRMVIEGEIDSSVYYWPITIDGCQTEEYAGVERGCRYTYDIRIRRKGVTDPDIPFNPGSIDINLKVKPWMEKEEYSVLF